MKNAEAILKEKGYDNFEITDILQANKHNLDMQIREKYGLENQALHLWESYYIGDADEQIVLSKAIEHGFKDIDELLNQMDADLEELAINYPSKQ